MSSFFFPFLFLLFMYLEIKIDFVNFLFYQFSMSLIKREIRSQTKGFWIIF